MNEETIKNTILIPILKKMGFNKKGEIEYEKTLSDGKRLDLLLKKNNKNICVVECKRQGTNLKNRAIIDQVYHYAVDSKIRCPYFALCDGDKFVLYKTFGEYPVYQNENLQDLLEDTNENKKELNHIVSYLLEDSDFVFDRRPDDWYDKCLPPSIIVKPKNQATARNYGVHPYFTRQSWDIVTSHIRAFSQEGDVVLDPFGGTGVTLNESLLNKRHGIFIDLNPIAVFWRKAILNDTPINLIKETSESIIQLYQRAIKTTKLEHVKEFIPDDIPLKSRGSDFKSLHELFTEKQLKELGLLKRIILKKTKPKTKKNEPEIRLRNQKNEKNELKTREDYLLRDNDNPLRDNLLLAFSSCLRNVNLTYFLSERDKHSPNAGNSSFIALYRYRKAKDHFPVDLMETFRNKIKRLLKSKEETELIHYYKPEVRCEIYQGDASNMKIIKDNTIDYIYTDPPYGNKIEYLDLSVIFNAWLDLKVTDADYQSEAIAGGRLNKSKDDYLFLIEQSIKEMNRVLKKGRYLSFVFQDKSIFYFQSITSLFEKWGFELFAINAQKTGRKSFNKVKTPSSVLNSQLVLVYRKQYNKKEIPAYKQNGNWESELRNHIESEITKLGGATYEELHDSVVRYGVVLGIYDPDKFDKVFEEMLKDYPMDKDNKYQIHKTKGFKSSISIEKRANYFISAFLILKNKQLVYPTTDEILMEVMPSLKNGVNVEKENITDVLSRIAIEHHNGGWKFLGAAGVDGKLF